MITYVAFADYGSNHIHVARSDQPAFQDAPDYSVCVYAKEISDAINQAIECLNEDIIPYAPGTDIAVPQNSHIETLPFPL